MRGRPRLILSKDYDPRPGHTPGRIRPQNRAERRKKAAMYNLYRAKVARVTKQRGVMYAYSAATLALCKDWKWSAAKVRHMIEAVTEMWGEYTARDEHQLIDRARAATGVDVPAVMDFGIQPEECGSAMKLFREAAMDQHIVMSCILIFLRQRRGFSLKNCNKLINHAWAWYLKSCECPDDSIMDICERITGIRYDMEV